MTNNDAKNIPCEILEIKNEQGVLIQRVSYKNGMIDGLSEAYDPETGDVIQEAHFKRGLLHGELTIYDKVGNVACQYNYSDNLKNGVAEMFIEGSLIMKSTYKNDLLEGEVCYYSEDVLIAKENYVNGLKEGKSVAYDNDGNMVKSATYKKGKLDGVSIVFASGKDNQFAEYDEYKEGKLNGISKKFHDNGVIREIRVYSNGKLSEGIKKYDRDGNEIK